MEQLMHQAVAHQRAGQLQQAAALYHQVLQLQPENVDALHLLGLTCFQMGQLPEASDLIQKALARHPDFPLAHFNLGIILKQRGLLEQAAASYRKAIALRPDYVEAYDNLGNVLLEMEQSVQAVEYHRRALDLKPGSAIRHYNLAVALRAAAQPEEAVTQLRQAIAQEPAYAEAHFQMGEACASLGQEVLAATAYLRAIGIRPADAEAHFALGNVMRRMRRIADVVLCYQRGLKLKPETAWAHNNLGLALQVQNRLNEAIECFERAIQLDQADAGAHWNLSLVRLLKGDFEQGWRDYEWRWKAPGQPPSRVLPGKQWDGKLRSGETVLLYAEQGFGDTLQFVRYVPLLAAGGMRVVLEVQPELRRLLGSLAGVQRLVARGEALPDFDSHLPLMSLPHMCETRSDNIPATVPYLAASTELAVQWRERLAHLQGLRVGLVWAGSSTHPNDLERSLQPDLLSILAEVPGVSFVSLQKGQLPIAVPQQLHMHDAAADLNDFADTAAVVANLDLVIAVDTSVAHLAAALGKPVWLLLPFSPDWRWMLEREDSPWYPGMRLFRQATPREWRPVLWRVAQELAAQVHAKMSDAQGVPSVARFNPVLPAQAACKCCGASADYFGAVDLSRNCEEFRGRIFSPMEEWVPYFRCRECGFLFSDYFDHWTRERFAAEIYNAQYPLVDPDFVEVRPASNAALLEQWFGSDRAGLKVLDYGGGNGELARRLREKGFNAASFDPLYDQESTQPQGKFDLVVSFEVVEHMPDPAGGFNHMLSFLAEGGLLFFSTLVQPADIETMGPAWWYAAPRNGHVSLHTHRSLALMLQRHGLQLQSLDDNLHLAYRTLPAFASRILAEKKQV